MPPRFTDMDTKKIASAFDFGSPILSVDECLLGHINNTFFVHCQNGSYVVQKINTVAFKKPHEVMSNIVRVTDHVREKLRMAGRDAKNGTLEFIKSGDRYFHVDDEGNHWRVCRFVDGSCFDSCDDPLLFYHAGKAFGEFTSQLSDFDATSLFEPIPDFHDTVKRYEALERAIQKDACQRAAECEAEIAFIRERKDACSFIVKGLENGTLPLRVTHSDTKLNNVILNKETGEGLCVIDLDTVMPGSLLCDFGDAVRYGASAAAEDEEDLSKVFIRTDMFEAYTKGFLAGLNGNITRAEAEALTEGARILTLELAIRFLTDYLEGDVYFRTKGGKHNLIRARNQIKLVEDIEKQYETLQAIVKKYL
ncbi:MAG: aminoglycoside phosphotransferase family protein [Clostridia bacterium]|nr:aminoglycoside phosphotransferase family protein [Clostridia bacterium]